MTELFYDGCKVRLNGKYGILHKDSAGISTELLPLVEKYGVEKVGSAWYIKFDDDSESFSTVELVLKAYFAAGYLITY